MDVDTGDVVRLSRHQLGVAAVVSHSHATIPPGFTVAKVAVDGALAYARAATRRLRTLIGLPELLVKAIAAQRDGFPSCLGIEGRGGAANVGLSIDVGTGLYVPVIHGADQLGLGDIGTRMLEYRRIALKDGFRPAQLEGATIMVTLSTELTLFSRPIVYPGQVCAVSLGATTTEVRRSPTGTAVTGRVAYVGLAYDHRIINGREAGQFLTALKDVIESLAGDGSTFD